MQSLVFLNKKIIPFPFSISNFSFLPLFLIDFFFFITYMNCAPAWRRTNSPSFILIDKMMDDNGTQVSESFNQSVQVENSSKISHQRASVPLRERLKNPPRVQPECCIFKIHNHLWEINETAYTPQIVAIGPYHRCRINNTKKDSSVSLSEGGKRKVDYGVMEEHKLRYLDMVLKKKGIDVGFFIDAIGPKVEKVRSYYADPLSLMMSDDELLEIMVLDGCFIIEFLRMFHMRNLRHPDDPIFKMEWIMNSLQRDLLLFENQLPLFILLHLFGMIERQNDNRFVQLALDFFHDIIPDARQQDARQPKWNSSHGRPLDQVKHLLELVHLRWLFEITPEIQGMMNGNGEGENQQNENDEEQNNHPKIDVKRKFIRCATELREAGVKFKKYDEGKSLFDIRFIKGTLQIPPFVIEDRTEALLRNLVAYEQYQDRYAHQRRRSFVTDYVCFLDSLIDTSKDVEILCSHGIIDNLLGDDKTVSDIFNKITDSVILPSVSSYTLIEKRVNSHCERRWNRWMATLRHNHFDGPWGITSVVAGILLLLLTSTQVYFAIFPRSDDKS